MYFAIELESSTMECSLVLVPSNDSKNSMVEVTIYSSTVTEQTYQNKRMSFLSFQRPYLKLCYSDSSMAKWCTRCQSRASQLPTCSKKSKPTKRDSRSSTGGSVNAALKMYLPEYVSLYEHLAVRHLASIHLS